MIRLRDVIKSEINQGVEIPLMECWVESYNGEKLGKMNGLGSDYERL